jgi:transcriptional regulator with XRE-family HTH domain
MAPSSATRWQNRSAKTNLRVLEQARLYRRAREKACLTRGAVARRLGWPIERIAELEAGGAAPSLHEALQLAHLYVAARSTSHRQEESEHQVESCGRVETSNEEDPSK